MTFATERALTGVRLNAGAAESGGAVEPPAHAALHVHERVFRVPVPAYDVPYEDRVVVELEQRAAATAQVDEHAVESRHVLVPAPFESRELVVAEPREHVRERYLVGAQQMHPEVLALGERGVAARRVRHR